LSAPSTVSFKLLPPNTVVDADASRLTVIVSLSALP